MRNWQRMVRLCALTWAVLTWMGTSTALAAKPKVSKLTILYTTDLYGQMRDFRCKRAGTPAANDYEATPRDISNLLYQVNRIRKRVIAQNDPTKPPDHGVLLFNTGDNLATATAARFLLEFKGIAGVDFIANVFARFGYSLIGIGNHEFSVTPEKLRAFIQQARLKDLRFSAANLDKSPPNHVFTREVNQDSAKRQDKYFIFQEASLKIGVFHVVPEGMESKVAFASGLKFGSPSSAIERIVPILRTKEKVDLVIMMSHLDDGSKGKNIRELLANYSDDAEKRIDLVITNGLRESGKPLSTITLSGKNSSYIVGGYQYGTQLGRVDLRVSRTKSGAARLESFNVQSIPLDDKLYDPGLRRELSKWERSYCKRWGKPLGQGRLRKEMTREQFVKYFLNYMRHLGQGEIAMINKGAIPEGKPFPLQGYITTDDLYRAIPFPQDIYVREVTGAELNNMSNKSTLEFVGYDGSNVNGRAVVDNGKYRIIAIQYVAKNRGGWFGDVKGNKALKSWKPVRYKNGAIPEIRRMMIAHFATNDYRNLPYTPPPKPEAPDDSDKKKKPPPPPKPFNKGEIPHTGDFLRLDERLAWEFKTGFILAFESIFANPINLSGFYGESQSFSNQFFQKYQINVEWNWALKFHTNKHEWNNEFVVGYTAFSSRVFNSDTAKEQALFQEERDELKFQTKYVFKPFGSAERKWYHTNPFVRGIVQTEMTTGTRPDLAESTIFGAPLTLAKARNFFLKSGESEIYDRFRVEAEAGLTFNISQANLNIDFSFAFRKQFALNPFTKTKADRGEAATEADLTINTDANLGGSIKAELSELQLFKINKTPFVWVSSAKYTLLLQIGAFSGSSGGLITHDFEWKNKFAFKLQGNIELAFGADIYMYRGVFKPDPLKNIFVEGPFAFRIDPKVSLNVSWGARGQTL